MNVAIRTATVDDLERLGEIRRRASWSNQGDRDLLRAHPEYLDFDGAYVVGGRTRLAALDDGTIVGFVTTIPTGDAFELEDLFVDPDFMRRGVATALVLDMLAVARASGITRIDVTANPHALAFYESVGFADNGVAQTEGGPAARLRLDVVS
jgi:GNAT superfamily N-acetyltransferase